MRYLCILIVIIIIIAYFAYEEYEQENMRKSLPYLVEKNIREKGYQPSKLLIRTSFIMDPDISKDPNDLLTEGPPIILHIPEKPPSNIRHFLKNSKRKFIITLNFPDDLYSEYPNCIHTYSVHGPTKPHMSPFPSGLPFHEAHISLSPLEQEHKLLNYYNTGPNIRNRKLICIAGWNDDPAAGKFKNKWKTLWTKIAWKTPIQKGWVKEGRYDYAKRFQDDIIEWESSGNRDKLWETFSQSAFAICPIGVKVDTYRLWEALNLGCIAIVQETYLNPLMEGFPVIVTDHPETLTKEVLQDYVDKIGWMCHDPEVRKKYTYQYWKDKVIDKLNSPILNRPYTLTDGKTIFNPPVFDNLIDFQLSPWYTYLRKLYKDDMLNITSLPDLSNFMILYEDLLHQSNIDISAKRIKNIRPTLDNQIYRKLSWDPPHAIWIWKPPPFNPVPSNTWVEVTHLIDDRNIREGYGAWYYIVPGSGIFLFTGTTIHFDDHKDMREFIKSKDNQFRLLPKKYERQDRNTYFAILKSLEFDTVQFLKHGDQKYGLMAREIVSLDGLNFLSTGYIQTPFSKIRTGFHHQLKCIPEEGKHLNCDNTKL